MSASLEAEAGDFSTREFPMTDADFKRIKTMTMSYTGISLSDHKRNMVYGRLARRLRRLGVPSFKDYCDLVESDSGLERTEFINSITTNLTSFFREGHHFKYLKEELFPELLKKNASSRRVRIWSAGCSTGEEPYSIAMVVSQFVQFKNWDVKILATDLDTNVVQRAKEGVYTIERADGIPDEYRKYLRVDKTQSHVKVTENAQSLITFKPLNLLHSWPMSGPFDIIFCRNVVIYFNAETQRKLFDRYAEILCEDGHLFIGHSESLHNVCDRFKSLGRTIYKRTV